MKKRLKINGFIMFIAVVLAASFPAIFFHYKVEGIFEELTEVSGIALILLGQIFRVSARGFKSEHSQEGRSLIQGGPYALVRNPMYLGILLIGLGVVLMLFKWWVACIFLAVFITRYIVLIFKEEKKLLALFPEAYRDYCSRVPRILPRPATFVKGDISGYLPVKLSWLKREVGSILAVLFITIFIESRGDIKTKGLWAYAEEASAVLVTIILFVGLVVYLNKMTREGLKRDVSTKSKTI
ncbi:MAG: isoprenylcysteine carboxylmethyltransferase family protein [Candidatus Omnitrophica bacterium]|nr:isoprenylcysteine carboxylmethyltransferase family protein [Candidatus Omnitrophota bacterium]